MPQITLRTARLDLIPLGDEHLEHEVELDSDPEVLRYLSGRARSPSEVGQVHQKRLARAEEVDGLGIWAGFLHAESESFVGLWMLQPPRGPSQPKVPGEADLGYRLLRRHWRQGLASEGSRELIRHGFEDLGLNRIFAQTMAVNAPSRATMSSLGMRFVRSFHEDYDEPVPGSEQGEVEYEMRRQDWLTIRS
jgi:RimJ/RimL family protein N-acetyltransferase